MPLKKQKKILDIMLSVLLAITGIAFIVAVLHLYFTGDANPYTRERAGEYLAYLSIPSALTVIATVWSGVISILIKSEERKAEAYKAPRTREPSQLIPLQNTQEFCNVRYSRN